MIKVLSPGIYSSIQDGGRKGFGQVGVPSAGVMDSYAANLGNLLLNNDPEAALIEITFGASRFEFLSDQVICITGANFSPQIDGHLVTMNQVLQVPKGAILSFGKRQFGVRTYLAIREGFDSPTILKSRSFFKGISPETTLKKGDILLAIQSKTKWKSRISALKISIDYFYAQQVVCSKGPEFDLLSGAQQAQLLNTSFLISKENNRMGYRLETEITNAINPILTSGVLPGTVQLTPSGKLIILMRDCQVTGGYPRVLQVSEAGLNILAQKSTFDCIQFHLNS